ncbi:anti-sigma F factor antagonist [Clostridium perfringens]|nr:Anti-sigma F factor antagonist [Clostridium perfringens]SQB57520.1 anti-sigma F factor antagonist [Clostridium perfringens]SUY35458.1 anti-sigma F factor antagonist [Clostridium perfringens]VTQ66268.1 anti-sigma F factor antagonist [Clostridium perfringens]
MLKYGKETIREVQLYKSDCMWLDFEKIGNVLVVSLIGELDHHSAEEVRVKIDDRISRENIRKLVLDFSGVTFMDSSGIGVIIGRYKKISMRSGEVNIISVSKSIKRVFELSGIFKIIKYYENLDEALKVG